ncbi:ubiquitin-specific protease doa4 [Rhodotorula toruloides]
MFWRSIPAASGVLARPDGDVPPPRPPRPPRPPSQQTIPSPSAPPPARSISEQEQQSLKKFDQRLNVRTTRSAVEAVLEEQRHAKPRHMADVVEAAVARDARERSGKGLRAMLKKRKSVVGLFKRTSLEDERRPAGEERRSTATPALSRRSSRSSSSSTLSESSDEEEGGRRDNLTPNDPSKRLAIAPTAEPPRPQRQLSTAHRPYSPAPEPPKPPSYRGAEKKDSFSWRRLRSSDFDDSPPESPSSSDLASYASSHADDEPTTSGQVPIAVPSTFADPAPPYSCSTGKSELSKPRVSGLRNLGNTCYLACIVQALAATTPLADFFLRGDYEREVNRRNREGTQGALAEAPLLLRALKVPSGSTASSARVRAALGRLRPDYLASDQQDAHECLLTLLDGLHEDLNLVLNPPSPRPPSPGYEAHLRRLPEVVAADLEWSIYRERNDSVVIDFFQGQIRNRLECLDCHRVSTTFSPLQTLSLSLPLPRKTDDAVSLASCIDGFLQEEILDGENAWNCPRCRRLCPTSKRLSVARLPQFLIIHLKRFTSLSDRLATGLSFPLSNLHLAHLLPPMALAPKPPFRLNLPHEPETTYELYAVCCHLGATIEDGHYTALVRHSSSWFEIDDERVRPLDTPAKLERAFREAEKTSYLLFYRIQRAS